MADRNDVRIVTYNGVDGACAAAIALLKHPKARLAVTSAARVGQTLAELSAEKHPPTEVHVCGVGVSRCWPEVLAAAQGLRAKGTHIFWYCGRGYLDGQREQFERVGSPVFLDLRANAEAVCEHLGLKGDPHGRRLTELARHDPNNEKGQPPKNPTGEQQWWLDLIEASISQYFKYQDTESYAQAIYRLAEQRRDEHDEHMVKVYRSYRSKYMLQGKSAPMRRLRELIKKCAVTDEHILVTGESGVGKEHVAHLLHEGSSRGANPFVPVNCTLFTGNTGLANSVLFGHVRGAFTGAERERAGAFVTADSGTLFLDEIGELPAEVQGKLLRVLEDGWVTPEGSDEPKEVDVRVVAATNRDLGAMIREGRFRDDLYHRMETLRIHVPPLREHTEDIPLIAEHVLVTLGAAAGAQRPAETDMEHLRAYDWPGNVRQLIKLLKRATYLGMDIGAVIAEEHRLLSLAPAGTEGAEPGALFPERPEEIRPLREVQRAYARRALELNEGNQAATARMLKIAPNTLRAYLAEG